MKGSATLIQAARSSLLSGSIGLGFLTILAGGCATETVRPSSGPPTVDVTGTWSGVILDGPRSYTTSMDLKQVGSTVTGTGHTNFPVGSATGAVEGTVSGNELTYRTRAGANGHVIVTGDEMAGTSSTGLPIRLRRQQ